MFTYRYSNVSNIKTQIHFISLSTINQVIGFLFSVLLIAVATRKRTLIPYKSRVPLQIPQAVSFQCQGPRTWDLGRWALN